MSTLTIFAIVFLFILVCGGWITSEYISHKNARENKKLKKSVHRLEHENDRLTNQFNKQNTQYSKLKGDYDNLMEAKEYIKVVEQQYKSLLNRHTNFNRGLDIIRKTVTSKKYLNNSLAKEIVILLTEHLPDDSQIEMKKNEESLLAFKRIRDKIN